MDNDSILDEQKADELQDELANDDDSNHSDASSIEEDDDEPNQN